MKCNILHETPGRMRVHLALRRMSLREADLLEYDLKGVAGVVSVKVFDRTQDAVITYTCPRADIVRALSSFSFTSERALARLPEHTSRALNREYEDKLVFTVCRRAFSRLFLPVPVQTAIALFRSVKYIRAGLSALLHGKLSVAVLDATAVTLSLIHIYYKSLKNALRTLVQNGVEHGVIHTSQYSGDVEEDLPAAVYEFSREDPIGAYAIDYITHDCTLIVAYYEIRIDIRCV